MVLNNGCALKFEAGCGYVVMVVKQPGSCERRVKMWAGDVGKFLVWLHKPFSDRANFPFQLPAEAGDDAHPYDCVVEWTHLDRAVVAPDMWFAKIVVGGVPCAVEQFELEVVEAGLRANAWRLLA